MGYLTNLVIPPWVKPVAVLLVIIGLFLGGYFKGKHDVQVEWDLEKEKTALQIAELKNKSDKVTTQVVTQYVDRVRVIKEKGATITKYVDNYITKEADSKCVIPKNAILFIDSAAKNDTQFLKLAETLSTPPKETK